MIKALNVDDEKMLLGISKADSRIIENIYELALPSIILYVKENSGSEADARDIFQDAIIALFRRLESGDFILTCTLKSYLRIMCRNLWLTKLRKKKNIETDEWSLANKVELDNDILSNIENAEKTKLFFKYFEALGDSCRKILQFYFDKIPVKEIAKQLDTSESYIKKRKFKCKEKLVKSIQADPIFKEL